MYESAENRQYPSPGTLTVLLGTVKLILGLPGPYVWQAIRIIFIWDVLKDRTAHHCIKTLHNRVLINSLFSF